MESSSFMTEPVPFKELVSTFPSTARRLEEFDVSPYKPPIYKRFDLYQLVHKQGYIGFAKDVDHLQELKNGPVADRNAMDSMWFRILMAKASVFDARQIKSEEELEKKLFAKQTMMCDAMLSRKSEAAERYWIAKAEKYPGLDITDLPEDDVTDHMGGYLQIWGENVDDGASPEDDELIRNLPKGEINAIREAYNKQKASERMEEDMAMEEDGMISTEGSARMSFGPLTIRTRWSRGGVQVPCRVVLRRKGRLPLRRMMEWISIKCFLD